MGSDPLPDDLHLAELFVRARRAAAAVAGDGAADDLAAEAVVRLLARWPRPARYGERWVVVVATNLAVDLLRRRPAPQCPVRLVSFEDETVERLHVEELLGRLPRRQRQAVALRYLIGCSETEVAELLGVSKETVRTHLRRARQELRGSDEREEHRS